ncbi:MAG: nucleoside diphosphate kinase regulator [Sphingomonas sp.]|nr:nucleoside diphosphate kinase regulator [Sphingomonas sp.]
MTTDTDVRARPRIRLIDEQADIITQLALQAESRMPDVAALLLEEVDRAEIYGIDTLPAEVVTLGAEVEFLDEGSGQHRRVTIVLPAHADIEAGRVSILTPVGAGLIGLAVGQAIDWPDMAGRSRRLRILSVGRTG